MHIDISTARQRVSYDPFTGVFTWLISNRGSTRAGDVAGSVGRHGYWFVKINQVKYPAARLAWAMVHGVQPQGEIDHIDGVRLNNRIANLREADRWRNAQNVKGLGYRYEPDRNKWLARICHGRKTTNLGRFDTEAEAKAAYETAKRLLRGDFARG